jgi:hypothetical protein
MRRHATLGTHQRQVLRGASPFRYGKGVDRRGVDFFFITLYNFFRETTQMSSLRYLIVFVAKFGGARGSRTPDLLNAIQALSQLSYGP